MSEEESEWVSFPKFPVMWDRGYKTICADPPWPYEDSLSGPGRGAESHYDTLPVGMIQGLGEVVNEVSAPNAHLYLWTTNSFMEEAHEVCRAWGFEPKTILTWKKPQMGMGHYFRSMTEHVVFGVKGNLKTPKGDLTNFFSADRTEHSSKPKGFYSRIEIQSPPPRLEMFARDVPREWDVWGKEVGTRVVDQPSERSEIPNPSEW